MEGPKNSADTMVRHLENVYSREATQEMQRYEVSSDSLPFELACPITLPDILSAIRSLPSNKAPDVDHNAVYRMTSILYSPPIDITQGGFRECRGSLDQAFCLAEICQILRVHHKVKPTLIFLDIKSAYDTVDSNLIWQSPIANNTTSTTGSPPTSF
ncbi:hypothetical protein G6F37_009283 [Rhizopus arrhizus]|nr:hypothetical protein G6F38_009339 [Rhizopus arrhizus]KAG1154619.1 hypothetical protein G6F37_009283 [Rhizopus arrhizus]